MSHPVPGEVRLAYRRTNFSDLYQVFLEPEGVYLGLVECGWRAYRDGLGHPFSNVFKTRGEAGAFLRDYHKQHNPCKQPRDGEGVSGS
jgi:hypothetical protein